jgi:hypothetical protein
MIALGNYLSAFSYYPGGFMKQKSAGLELWIGRAVLVGCGSLMLVTCSVTGPWTGLFFMIGLLSVITGLTVK